MEPQQQTSFHIAIACNPGQIQPAASLPSQILPPNPLQRIRKRKQQPALDPIQRHERNQQFVELRLAQKRAMEEACFEEEQMAGNSDPVMSVMEMVGGQMPVANSKGFDCSTVKDLKYPHNQYHKWDDERKRKLFARITCLPPHFLTVGTCKKAVVLAEMLNRTLSPKFLARQEELERDKVSRTEAFKAQKLLAQQNNGAGMVRPINQQSQPAFPVFSGVHVHVGQKPAPPKSAPATNLLRNPTNQWQSSIKPPGAPGMVSGPFTSGPNSVEKISSEPGSYLLNSRPEVITSKINSLFNKFCGKPLAIAPSLHQRETFRVPSPVDFGKNPWDKAPVKNFPPEEIAKAENYTLEEPQVRLTKRMRFPITVQEIESVSDMVLLCQLRDAPSVCKPFVHPTTIPLLRALCQKLGNGFNIQEVNKTQNCHQPMIKLGGGKVQQRITTHVWIQGITKLITLGEAVDTNMHSGSAYAHASCLASLVYMMVIPFQLILAVQACGEQSIPMALYACKKRIKELIAVTRDSYYCPLLLHEGTLSDCNQSQKELWANFINRMRHMGMNHWEDNQIRVPPYWQPFPEDCVKNFYFQCVHDKEPFSWEGMVPNSFDVVPFDIEDFMCTFSCSRFSCSAAEQGLLPPEPYQPIDHAVIYHLKHNIPNLPEAKYDPIVHLPFRDLLYKYGTTVLSPMFTLFTVKYIGHRWGRRLCIKHQMVIDVDADNKETWKHVVQLSFDGIPYFFLGAKCAKDNFSSALVHGCSIIAQQLSAMMIIPKELCELLESKSRTIVAAVIYGCRTRFATFEALMRNPMFASLIIQETAEVEFHNPLYKLAEFFYWRMRNTGWTYWMDHRLIKVPMGMINTKILPTNTFFQFQESFDKADWTSINSPEEIFDHFDVKVLCPEDRFPAHWEGGGRTDESSQPALQCSTHPSHQPAAQFKDLGMRELEDALIREFRVPLFLLSAKECEAMLNIVRSLAGMGMTVLQMKVQSERLPTGSTLYQCEMSWAGSLGWILNAKFSDEREANLYYGAAWILYKLLIRMGMLPPGLYKFIAHKEDRLPYVLSTLSIFFSLLESIVPTYSSQADEDASRGYLIDEMHQLTLAEWPNRIFRLPIELMPSMEETGLFPFIRTEVMGFKEYEEWKRTAPMFQRKAEILDMRNQQVKQPNEQPGLKIGKKRFSSQKDDKDHHSSGRRDRKDTEARYHSSSSSHHHHSGPSSNHHGELMINPDDYVESLDEFL